MATPGLRVAGTAQRNAQRGPVDYSVLAHLAPLGRRVRGVQLGRTAELVGAKRLKTAGFFQAIQGLRFVTLIA
jgi:hypothetical protein